jgi:hypothetical protein
MASLTLKSGAGKAMGAHHAIFEPMRAAFNRVCEILRLDCDADDQMTELVVMKIVGLAKTGDVDPERLCIGVPAELDAPPEAGASEGWAA